jgi:16S rRNA (cytosine967-C5)-methyltransferase
MDLRERQWTRELVFGTERMRGRIDHILGLRLKSGIDSVPPRILDLLRIGAYQLLYMGGVPQYAAVSQSVEEAKRNYGKGLGGLVNAVLRGVGQEGAPESAFPDPTRAPSEFLATWGSHPPWLIERWLARWDFEEVRRLVEANNRKSTMTVRPLRGDVDGARDALISRGFSADPVEFGSACLQVAGASPVELLEATDLVVQDPASAAVADYVGGVEGAVVADLCAAPGGKTLVLAGAGAYVVAADPSTRRLELLRQNLSRLQGQIGSWLSVGLVASDARRPPVENVDVVLLDVPCTGSGTLRRNPDARWRLSGRRLKDLTTLQRTILDGSADSVKSGGLLVYSTCSLEREENQDQVYAFLERRSDFCLEPGRVSDERLMDEDGMLEVRPQVMGFDGAFAARLRRA